MLNSLTLLRAMNGIYEEDVVMAGNSYFDEKQVKHLKTKRIISFALAAALILSLGIAAYAAFSSMTHRVNSCRFLSYSSIPQNRQENQRRKHFPTHFKARSDRDLINHSATPPTNAEKP